MPNRIFSLTLTAIALVAGASLARAQVPDGYFRLQSAFLQSQDKCLESNRVAQGATLGGATYMDACQNVSGQLWKAIAQSNGYYQLTSMYREGDGECLESSRPDAPGDALDGAARMDPCGNFSGQMWKFVDLGNGYFHVQSMFQEPENRCLESVPQGAPDAPWTSGVRMDPCGDFYGQMWQMVPQ